ncbi:MAG TPA: MotA/TolQ/ExbB proton channel family protein [Bacteroidia bacterium]|jgi:biopolymer transport protein ExbB|nr:MotA/TolQ/ExbB proton channel family protein [Bacteroidia bacterium]HQF27243.1 MotA/TolQ/ExbB proton channel family protein [Bacteroidia bacterium]HQK96722.1 MotA/TolQ/ExbB proton channel family protein [Bacteroidia bacterium]
MSLLLQIQQAGSTVADTIANAAAPIAAAAPVEEKSISLWEMASKGGPILIPIGILSILALFIFFERLFVVLKASKLDMNFMNQIKDYVNSGNVEAARMLCRNTHSPVARMIEKGIMRLGKPVREIEAAIENTGKLEIYKLERNLGFLGTIAGIAPMFGFLGTIFGVIKIFYQISLQNSLEIDTISGGLYVKMISSGSGLLVGMIAYAGYHYLVQLIDRVINKMEISSVEFIDLLEEPAKP